MTLPIIDKKIDEFRMYDAAAAIAIAMVAWLLANGFINFIFQNIVINMYHLPCSCKLLKIAWPIVDRKAIEFKTFGAATFVAVTVAMIALVLVNKLINFIYQ